jgi:hypothetical protein
LTLIHGLVELNGERKQIGWEHTFLMESREKVGSHCYLRSYYLCSYSGTCVHNYKWYFDCIFS